MDGQTFAKRFRRPPERRAAPADHAGGTDRLFYFIVLSRPVLHTHKPLTQHPHPTHQRPRSPGTSTLSRTAYLNYHAIL